VFTPLALNFRHHWKWGIFIALFITFIISGFWHGAGLHFVVWGGYYGLLYIPYVFSKKGIKSMISKKTDPVKISDLPKIILTFSLVCLGYIFFRSSNLSMAIGFIRNIVTSIYHQPQQFMTKPDGMMIFFYSALIIFLDYFLFQKNVDKVINRPFFRSFFYILIAIFIATKMGNQNNFIYFNF
jgi:hypothetical protein